MIAVPASLHDVHHSDHTPNDDSLTAATDADNRPKLVVAAPAIPLTPAALATASVLSADTCMPPRLASVSRSGNGFYPASDAATYRDLLFFEERLKSNAAVLNRRKHRYQRGS